MNVIDGLMPVAIPIADYLLNSLVLGTALTALVALLLRLWRALNPSTRYGVWLVTMLTVVASPILASPDASPWNDALPFVSSAETASTSSPSASSMPPPTRPETATQPADDGGSAPAVPSEPNAEAGEDRPSSTSSAASSPPDNASVGESASPAEWQLPATAALGLVGIWALAALIGLGRLAKAYVKLARLRRAREPIAAELDQRWQRLAQSEGINRVIKIRRSEEISSPMLAGCGRPLVLLPSELLRQMSTDDLDRLILHELAHIARWDDVLKLAQELIRVLFILHPAIGWIARQLDTEREMACDDWAVTRRDQSRDRYAASLHALVRWAVQDHAQKPKESDSALTARTQLERRLRRMLRTTWTASARLMRTKLAGAIGLLLVGAGALALTMPTLGVGGVGGLGPVTQSQQACTVTLSPDDDIQPAIDEAESGDMVCLEPGEWQESVDIAKSLTLRGIGEDRVTIQAGDRDVSEGVLAVVAVQGEDLDVELRNLRLVGAEAGTRAGIQVAGSSLTRSATLTVANVRIEQTGGGLSLGGEEVSAQVRNSVITNLGGGPFGRGVRAFGDVELTVGNTRIMDNNVVAGMDIGRGATAIVRETIVQGNALPGEDGSPGSGGVGINVAEGHLRLINSTVQDNGGPAESGPANIQNAGVNIGLIELQSVKIPPSGGSAEIVDSRIEGNQHGLMLGPDADLTLQGSQVRQNRSWGLATPVEACVDRAIYDLGPIQGELQFAGNNAISENNTSGQLDDQGNPGDHPFTNLPAGQVCLPMNESERSDDRDESTQAVPAECSVALAPDESLQAAIDEADRGDTICLESGEWQESISIDKSVSLRGLGDERATIRGTEKSASEGFSSVVLVRGEDLDIELRSLELLSAERGALNGLQVAGSSLTQSANLSIRNVRIANTGQGMSISGPDVTATVRDSVIEANDGFGIVADRAESLTVVDSVIADNDVMGIELANGVQATVRDSTIRDTAAVSLPGQVRGQAGIGINVGAKSRLDLIDSVVRNNGAQEAQGSNSNGGIVVGAFSLSGGPFEPVSATANIVDSRIEANWLGLLLGQAADLTMTGTTVRGNRSWGLAGKAIPCGTAPEFTGVDRIMGDIQLDGGNVIEGNNVSGHLEGSSNPGEHPFTDAPDGQVCLPQD